MDILAGPLLTIVAPVFGVIGIGYAATKSGLFRDAWIDGLSAYVFRFAIPLLLFSSMARLDLAEVFEPDLLIAYYSGAFLTFIVVGLIARRLFGRPMDHAITIGMGGTFSNAVLVGLPMTIVAFGEAGAAKIILLIAFHGPLLLTVTAILMAFARGREAGGAQAKIGAILLETARDMVRNPVLIGVFTGVAWNITGWPLTGVPATLIERFAATAGTCALFAGGASLTRYAIARSVPVAAMMSAGKLILLPAIVAVLCLVVFRVPMESARVAILMAAMPAGVNTFLVANYYKAAEGAASSAMVLSTALSVVTVSVVLILLGAG